MSRPSITVADRWAEPYFCEDKTDFHKLLLGTISSLSLDATETAMLAMGLRIVCHEYLALVLSEKITPYEMGEDWVKKELPGFKEMVTPCEL